MTARQTGWRPTYAGIHVGTYLMNDVECEWWDIPTGTTVVMLDNTLKMKA